MRAARLYIKDTGKYIELGQDQDFPFTLNKSIAEVQDVSKRNKTYSHTFKVPATEDNIKALGYPHIIGTDLDAVKTLRQACYIIVNGNVLEEGAVYVVSAMSDLDVRQFECVFIGGNEIWTEPLRTMKMSDLVTESVNYTDAVLQASFTSFTAGTDYIRWVCPYMYKFSDGQSPSTTGEDFWLAYRVDKLIIRMIGEAALGLALQGLPYFQLDSVFIEQNDTGASHGFWDYIFWSDRSRGEYDVSFPESSVEIGEFFPTDVTCLDYLLGFVRTFNCVMQWNNETSTLKIEPRFDWESWDGTSYSGFYGTDVDWSDKISKSNTVQYSLPYKRFIQLNYIADPNDSNNELLYGGKKELENDKPSGDLSTAANFPDRRYFVDTGNINEDGASVIDMYFHPSNPNLFSESFKKNYVASAFSLTPAFNNRFVKYDQIDFNHPNVFANRLFIYTRSSASDFTTGTNQWDEWRYTEDDGTTVVDYGTYPVMYTFGVFDDADGGTTLLNIGVYNNFSTLYTGGLYERFWKSTLDTFSTTRLLKAKVLMTRTEYIALDISNYFTALGQRFILNKIKDFDPMLDQQMVEVELLAVDAFRSSDEIEPQCATISAITGAGTQTTIITNDNDANINGRGVELQRGRYVYITAQATNLDNQDINAIGVTQSGATLTKSTAQTLVFNATADLDPYSRGNAYGMVRLSDSKCVIVSPEVGTGNVFKVCTYSGSTNNVSIDFSVNDGDTSNYVDRFPNFAVINEPSANVYTIASVGLTRSGAYPYARVWDLDISSQTITSRGILYPMGTSGSGNGMTQLVNLGTVGGKHCFAIFYAKATTATGVLYYAVYEYDASTNTLVEAVGDTLYKSGSNHLNADIPWSIEDGKGILLYLDRVAYDTEITTCVWNGTSLTIGTPSTFGDTNRRGLEHTIRKYYNDCEDSKTQYIMAVGFWNSGSDTGDVEVFPVTYNPTANTWDVSNYNSANADILLEDTTNPTSGHPMRQIFIGQVDKDHGAALSAYRTQGSGTTFRGAVMNNFEITNS